MPIRNQTRYELPQANFFYIGLPNYVHSNQGPSPIPKELHPYLHKRCIVTRFKPGTIIVKRYFINKNDPLLDKAKLAETNLVYGTARYSYQNGRDLNVLLRGLAPALNTSKPSDLP